MADLSFSDSTAALKAIAKATGALSGNVANAETYGYKGSQGYFMSLVTGNAGDYTSGGVLATVLQNVSAQGALESSDSPTHMSISGNGFFVVSGSLTTPQIAYTRAGHFFPDSRGNLQNAAGLFLQGWATDENGNVPANVTTSDLASLETINVSKVSGLSKATATLALQLNLPSTDAVGETHITNIPIYDSLGARHTVTVTWTRTIITPNTWTADVTCPDGTITKTNAAGNPYNGATPLVVEFDGQGQPMSYDGNTAANAEAPDIFITWDPLQTNAQAQAVKFDLGTIAASDGVTSRAGQYAAPTIKQDGRAFGTFQSVSISADGIVSAIFSNGQTLAIARVAIANFAAPDLLAPQTGNSWIQTDQSGSYVLGFANVGGMGSIVSNTLEKSTVDLAQSMTDLIELQNVYVGNTKVISTKKGMFDALMSIKS
ncbi:MAG: flagellar hook protein FlgE [Proteobacteria bacterium]|nr:flagellar hook protein FlgE [Pseudomonadota bacterium]